MMSVVVSMVLYPAENKPERVANCPHRFSLYTRCINRRTEHGRPHAPVRYHGNVWLRPPCSIRAKDNNRLLHDEIILYGCDPFDAPCYLTRLIDGVLGINEAAQLDDALASFDTDLE